MFRRVITGIAVALVVVLVLAMPTTFFALFAAALCGWLAFEWGQLCDSPRLAKLSSGTVMAVLILVSIWQPLVFQYSYIFVVVISNVFWFAVVVVLVTHPMTLAKPLWGKFGPEIGAIALFGFWMTLVQLHNQHFWLLVTVLAGSAMFDTFALLWGMKFGERKLSPKLSPSKTWEGVAGGTLAALTPIGIMALAGAKGVITTYPWYAPAAAFAIAFAPFGDLFESLLKRLRGVKNSGGMLPGHGGLFDRVDSHLATVPCCAGFVVIFG